MRLPHCAKELSLTILNRSTCRVQVSAVLSDKFGIFSWGWNSVGNGRGIHAEDHCLGRANRARIKNSTITIAGVRKRNGHPVNNLPCEKCFPLLVKNGIKEIVYLDKGTWKSILLRG